MALFTVRRTVAAATMALVAATLATPASAHELDEDKIAAKICPAGISTDGSDFGESADSGDEAEVELFAYEIDADGNEIPEGVCAFAIISTDEDSKLDGDYTLSGGSNAPKTGAVAGDATVTAAIVSAIGESATVTSAGKQLTPKSSKQKKAAKAKYAKTTKAAKAKYAKAVKAAKAKYKKAGKTATAKTAMVKKIAAAKKTYSSALAKARAALKSRTSPTERSYKLNLTVPFTG